MADERPKIPADLRRRVLVEAGHRCAVPTCRQTPVEIDHIDDWSWVREHRFENLIALCPTCHARKGSRTGQIDRKSLRQYKANLAVLNSRYGELERRLLEFCALELKKGNRVGRVVVSGGLRLQLWYLMNDGHLTIVGSAGLVPGTNIPMVEYVTLTSSGWALVEHWLDAQPLSPGEWDDDDDELPDGPEKPVITLD